ncbi:GATA transcription factor 12 [Zea mays]|jgi:hypothetical protein|uniref:GATA transcription factor 14 n=2 Tax=Zea mays TaxID=4577 RepID=A0A1D6EIM0_MAIZE|nr:zinc finger protein 703 [Zea mays]ONM19952.1 GATA transcription factor 14 [Zea mays]PWZ41690.1 GATA transcription factor 12 [Zea mays]|eukprot:XP_008669904.1 zinc finger protein 703 [Zea mays]
MPLPPPNMRTQEPHPWLRDAPDDLPDCDGTGACFPGGGLCYPDDPLELVHSLFPAQTTVDRSALGIGTSAGEPPCREQEQPLAESAYGGGGSGGRNSCGLSSYVLEGLSGLEEIDTNMFFADDALDGGGGGGGGEATQDNLPCDSTGAKPKPPAHMPEAGDVHASPLPAHMLPGALQAYDACRAFHGASPPMAAGGPLPDFVTNDGAPMPAAAGLHACGALPGIVSNGASKPPSCRAFHGASPPTAAGGPLSVFVTNNGAPMPGAAAGLHACVVVLPGIVSIGASGPPRMEPMPARASLHPNAAPAHAPPPPSPPSSSASSGSGRCPSSATSGTEFLQPHAWVVPRRQRSLPTGARRSRSAPRQRNMQAQKVCRHCHSPDTPQWRTGPNGRATLCNACGLRYAGHRLVPEYRPLTAPSFRSGQHSNRHRNVMKLREQMKAAATEEEPSEQPTEGNT